MTSLKDMPMITIEQKNRFRESALRVEEERGELAAECEAWSSMSTTLANKCRVDSQTFDYIDELRSTKWGDVLVRRDSRMKAEALEEALRAVGHWQDQHAVRTLAAAYHKIAEDK